MKHISHTSKLLAGVFAATLASTAMAQQSVLNLYSSRHYQTDEQLYSKFTEMTGIKINRIDGKEDELIQRIRREGAASPADVFITVDAANLQAADDAGLFAPVRSKVIDARIPKQFRGVDNRWFGFAYRARVIAYNKDKIKPADVQNYADLAAPKLKGKVCVRSGGHVYNRTLMASMIYNQGEDKAIGWANGLVGNLARAPKGGDTDQIRAVASGECDVAISNHYYYARLMASDKPDDQDVVRKVGIVFPDQKGKGTHINISGGGMLKHAPNKVAAQKFLEFLTSDEAQAYFANGNNEWPVVTTAKVNNPQLDAMGKFKVDSLSAGILAQYTPKAQRFIDRAGWK
jgi:iron(III) transport system substrate-binding protein